MPESQASPTFKTVAKVQGTALQNPFKGVTTYEEIDKQSFYGREQERSEVVRILGQNTLSLLYSRSGVGKSSLINAGIIPALRKLSTFFPVYIRITDGLIQGEETNYASAIIRMVKESAEKNGIDIQLPLNIAAAETITEFLYTSEFTYQKPEAKGSKKEVIPVFIFDQFEEIFSLEFQKLNVKDLLHDLSYLIESKIPATLEEKLKAYDAAHEDDQLLFLKDRLQSANKWYRILFSFREEYLPQFESLKDAMPSVFYTQGRYRLHPFTVATAATVIQNISAESEELDKETCKHLANLIGRLESATLSFSEEVQPFLLSLICKSLYPELAGPSPKPATVEAVKNENTAIVDDIINNFTRNVFRHVSASTQKFVEDDLITHDGKRTMYALSDIKQAIVRLEVKKLYSDPHLRYLNRVEYFNNSHVEILHDRLLKPLIQTRKQRRRTLFRIKALASVLLLLGLAVLGWKVYEREQAKVVAYNTFFKGNNNILISNIRNNIAGDALNTAPLFVSSADYLERLQSTPYFSNHNILDFSTKGNLLRDVQDSIISLFKGQVMVHQDKGDLYNKYNSDYRFAYTIQNNSNKTGAVPDTVLIRRVKENGFVPFVRLLVPHQPRKENADYAASPYYAAPPGLAPDSKTAEYAAAFNSHWLEISADSNTIAFQNRGKIFIYNTRGSTPLPEGRGLTPAYVLDITRLHTRFHLFASDSRFLLLPNEDFLINHFYDLRKRKMIYLPDVASKYVGRGPTIYGTIDDVLTNKAGDVQLLFFQWINDLIEVVLVDLPSQRPIFRLSDCSENGRLNDSILYFLHGNKMTLFNRHSLQTRSFTPPEKTAGIHLLQKTNQLAVIDSLGGIVFYDNATLQKKPRVRRNLLPPKASNGQPIEYINSFLSPDEKLLLINYQGNLEVYDLEGNRILNTFEKYEGLLASAVFNKDESVRLIDNTGSSLTWFYKLHAPAVWSDIELLYKKLKGKITAYDYNKQHGRARNDNLYVDEVGQ